MCSFVTMTNPLPSVIETDKIEIIFYDVEITNQTLIAPNLKKIFYRRCSGRMFDGDAIVYLEDCKFAEIPLSLPLGSTVDWYSKRNSNRMKNL